jgi:hypothetical protein
VLRVGAEDGIDDVVVIRCFSFGSKLPAGALGDDQGRRGPGTNL